MVRLVLLQLLTTVLAGVVAGMLGGVHALISALLGGLCCVVPNGLLALRLYANTRGSGDVNPMSFFIGEFIKIWFVIK